MSKDDVIDRLARLLISVLIGFGVLWLMGFFSSCTRTMYVPVTSVQHDSINLHTHSRDSIVVRDSVTIRERGDTVWLERWRIEYRDRIRTDTAYIERRDSVAVPYPVERKLSRKERLYMSAGRVAVPLAGAGIVLACIWIYRKKMT